MSRSIKLSTEKKGFWARTFLHQKLNNTFGYLFIILLAVFWGYLIARYTLIGVGLVGLIIGLFLVFICLLNTEAGLYVNIVYSFFAFQLSRLFFDDKFPVGLVSDVLILSTFISLFIQGINWKEKINHFAKNTVVTCILILFLYLFIELFNPSAKSFEGWFQTFRKMLDAVVLLFISFTVFKNLDSIKRFFVFLFFATSIVAIYGCFQQWHGLFEFEKNWAMADPTRFGLLFIGGDFRKFSTTSDATGLGVLMASCSVFFAIVLINQKSVIRKIVIGSGVLFMILAMAYSGTRTANAMFVAGLFMYVLITFNKKGTRIFAVISGLALVTIIYGPFYSSPTINRFRSTFTGSEDKSYNVRELNRAFIQPYIYTHPIGGGLGTTGASGLKYNAGHYLAGFPTDSGYLKKALETGWIGLLIICVLYFFVLRNGIGGYFHSKNETIKALYAASTSCVFSFYIAEFPQDAIGQITDVIVYYPLIAVILNLRVYDTELLEEGKRQTTTDKK